MSDWIKASEISSYLYCRRAWWLQRVHGRTPENVRELAAGSRYHTQHGHLVQRAVWLRRLAYTLLFITIAFVAYRIIVGV